ncbi:MAG: phosphate signaling complex protein PhoU [Alphaproteobacteria bacterium]|nr:phosphate signaling complex protein PhoU [Alphaproteobacteria bacterium SS10]
MARTKRTVPNPTKDIARQEPNAVLSPLVIRMAGEAENQVELAVGTVMRRDTSAAERVSANDRILDDLEHRIDEEAQKLLMAQQPSQTDLHEILGAMRIAGDLERIGDYAANIAKRVRPLASFSDLPRVGAVERMGRLVRELLSAVVNAYSRRDLAGAIDAWHRDEDLDDLYTSLHREVLTYMLEDPRNITGYIHLLFIAKNLERIGDHATNIAEVVHLMLSGEPFDKARPKGDDTSYQLVRPGQKSALKDSENT